MARLFYRGFTGDFAVGLGLVRTMAPPKDQPHLLMSDHLAIKIGNLNPSQVDQRPGVISDFDPLSPDATSIASNSPTARRVSDW